MIPTNYIYKIRSHYYGTQRFRAHKGYVQLWTDSDEWETITRISGDKVESGETLESLARACENWWDAFMLLARRAGHTGSEYRRKGRNDARKVDKR